MKIKNKLWLAAMAWLMFAFNAAAQTTSVVGLVVVVKYKDYKIAATTAQIDDMLNKPSGFNLWGNTTSVRQYFLAQSNNKLNVVSIVVDVELNQNSSYYHGKNLPYDGGQLLVTDVVAAVNAKYPAGFSGLSLHPGGNIIHFSIMSKSGPDEGAGVVYGLTDTQYVKNNGLNIPIKHVALISYTTDQNDVNVVCHEYGHSIPGWSDYYATAWSNLGNYCAMASAGSSASPMPVNPALRLQKGWIDNVINIGTSSTNQTYTATSNSYSTIYKYTNPSNPKEYLLIHPQIHGGYYLNVLGDGNVPDQGLAIYYVDEDGGIDQAGQMTHPMIRLVQADNLDEMHSEYLNNADVRGDLNDLYDNVRNSFPNGTPFRWKDGGEFGLSISNISAPGSTMTFTVNARPSTFIAKTDNNGTISPAGVISAISGQSKTFTLSPYPNYEVNQVKVNGVVTATSGTSITITASGTKTIEVSYKRKATPQALPTPWQHSDIGAPSTSGISGHASGKFYLESFGNDIWGNSDNFRFVYQTLVGDGSIVAKLTYANKPYPWSKAGIMIRESLQPNSAYSMLMYTPLHHTRVQQRSATGAYSTDDPNMNPDGYEHIYNLYKWFKITREGNLITSYCSLDKINWVQMAQQAITMGTQVYLGMAVSGASPTYPSRAIFDSITVVKTNVAPTIAIASPANFASFESPATFTVTVNASDIDGSISKVDFFRNGGVVSTDFTSPYTATFSNLPNGTHTITAKATDNSFAVAYATIDVFVTSTPVTITGPACGNINSTLTYELSAAKRTNATGYNWYYSGGSSNGIIPVSGTPYKANLSTGSNFSAGQVCVGVNYNGAPYYATYCVSVTKCSAARMGAADAELSEVATEAIVSYPNPFSSEVTIQLPYGNTPSRVQVYNASGMMVADETVVGEYKFGAQLNSGIYFVKVNTDHTTEMIKVVKE